MLTALITTPPPADVIEIGAGPGTISEWLAARGFRVVATDIRLDAALQVRAAGYRGPMSCVAEATQQPLAGANADIVVLSEVLEHVADDAALMAEAARLLRPGGLLVASLPAGAGRYGDTDRRAGHYRRYDRSAVHALLAGGGFGAIQILPWGGILARLYDATILAGAARLGSEPWGRLASLAGGRTKPSQASGGRQVQSSVKRHLGSLLPSIGRRAARWGRFWFELDRMGPALWSPAGWLVIARRS